MNIHAFLLLLSLAGAPMRGADGEFPWAKSTNARVSIDKEGILAVEGDSRRTQTHLLTIEKPTVPGHQYRLIGKIKFENVDGEGYVEMLNRFPGRGEFFTRTLAEGSAMGKIVGSSDWRDLELPFMSEPGLLPDRLTINLMLPGRGKVWITPLRMDALPALAGDGSGGSERGGWLDLFVVLLFVAGLVVCGLLGAFPRTRWIAVWACRLFAVASLLVIVLSLTSWGGTQSARLTMIVCGGCGLFAYSAGAVLFQQRLTHDERRRMQALDVAAE